MKRCWFGFLLLLILLAGGLASTFAMTRCHEPIAKQLEAAAAHSMAENWESAAALMEEAQARWRSCRSLSSALADHGPMEEIDGLFRELTVYAKARERVHFSSTCLSLSQKIMAMGEAHSLSWKNIL